MGTITQTLVRGAFRCYPFGRGQGRMIDRSFLGKMRFNESVLTARCSDGFAMRVNPNDHIGRHIFLTGQFDRTIVEVLRSFCRGGERILDIGANIGYVSCALLHLVRGCRVVAVEPQPAVFELLQRNVASVGGGRGTALRYAVSDHEGTARFVTDARNSGKGHLSRPDRNGGGEGIDREVVEVPLITAQSLLEMSRLDRLDLVKIDVEGHEQAVLQSLAPLLRAQRPRAVVFEHGGDLRDRASAVRGIFDEAGYRICAIHKSLLSWRIVPLEELGATAARANDYVALAG